MMSRGERLGEWHRYIPVPSVIETELPGELILLDAATQQMFSLNDTGKMIWRALPNQPLDGVVTLLTGQFNVTPDDANSAVRSLVSQLVDAGLLLPVNNEHD